MPIDLPSFVVGGLVGAGIAVVVWAFLRWWLRRRMSLSDSEGNGAVANIVPAGVYAPSFPRRTASPANGSSRSVPLDQVRMSERIVIALAREGRLGADSLVRPTRTQAGLAEALGSNQSTVSKVLRRLVAAELLTEERRHVQGRIQRLKVYVLTRRGEQVARDLARRRGLSLLPDLPGERRIDPPR